MEFEEGNKIELTPEQMKQVSGGQVGDTYTGWTCRNCNTSTATVVIVKDHEWENSDGYLIHSMGYEYHCDVCGDTWYSYSAENLGKPKPKKD